MITPVRSQAALTLLAVTLGLAACGGSESPTDNPPPPPPPEPNEPPEAAFTMDVSEGNPPLVVRFDASASSDPDGTVASYDWDWGDGETGSGQAASHTYRDGGWMRVTLTVTDDDGDSDTARDSVLVASPAGDGPNTLEGTVWWDQNLDDAQDPSEPGVEGVRVFLDEDGDGELDGGEIFRFTDAEGGYAFEGLDEREYTVTQALPFGWSNTVPGPDAGPVAASARAFNPAPARIIQGEETPIEPFPFQVAMLFHPSGFQTCGGTLVNSFWVLTAAHCADNFIGGDFALLFGTNDLRTGGELVVGTAARFHPNFDITQSLDYDIGLLRLETPQLRPRAFLLTPENAELAVPGVMATTIGWGQISDEGGDTDILRRVDLPIISNTECNQQAGEIYGLVTPRMLCAGTTELGTGACFGDSGGPLLVPRGDGWVQVGVTSALGGVVGRNTCGDRPTIYSRVSELIDYVYSVAGFEASGSFVVDWSGGPEARADFANYH